MIEIKTQDELDAALEKGEREFRFSLAGTFRIGKNFKVSVSVSAELKNYINVEAWGNSHVEAWGNSHVEAQGNSHVVARGNSHVEAWGNSHVVAWGNSHVEAWGNSHVEAWGNSHVEAQGNSHVVARENSHVEAKGFVSLNIFDGTIKMSAKCHAFLRTKKAKVTGGKRTWAIIKNVKEWCDFYGVEVKDGKVVLYKSVHKDFFNPHNRTVQYMPGTKPEATDWDGGKAECGGGLHFSPSVSAAIEFHYSSECRYVACPVAVKDIVIHPEGNMPQKCKAKKVCAPIWEVDRNGNKIEDKK